MKNLLLILACFFFGKLVFAQTSGTYYNSKTKQMLIIKHSANAVEYPVLLSDSNLPFQPMQIGSQSGEGMNFILKIWSEKAPNIWYTFKPSNQTNIQSFNASVARKSIGSFVRVGENENKLKPFEVINMMLTNTRFMDELGEQISFEESETGTLNLFFYGILDEENDRKIAVPLVFDPKTHAFSATFLMDGKNTTYRFQVDTMLDIETNDPTQMQMPVVVRQIDLKTKQQLALFKALTE